MILTKHEETKKGRLFHENEKLRIFVSSCSINYFLTSAMHHPNTLIGQALLHQTIVNYKKNFPNKIIKVSLFDITI